MQMDNDAKYAENLQVRVTHAFARILTGQDVTMPDAEFVYEGADEIPGRPQSIVDTLLAANDAYDTMAGYSESGDVQLIFDAAEALGVDWDSHVEAAVRETVVSVEAQVEADAEAGGRLAASGEPADVAVRFATALAVCDALLNVVSGHAETVGVVGPAVADAADVADEARATAIVTLPILLYVNELREQCSIPRICLTDQQILDLIDTRANAGDTLTATAEYITDSQGRTVDFKNTILIMTSNLGSQFLVNTELDDEAKKKAKEEDEKRNKEALAAKFAHIKDDPGKETVEL